MYHNKRHPWNDKTCISPLSIAHRIPEPWYLPRHHFCENPRRFLKLHPGPISTVLKCHIAIVRSKSSRCKAIPSCFLHRWPRSVRSISAVVILGFPPGFASSDIPLGMSWVNSVMTFPGFELSDRKTISGIDSYNVQE